MRLKAKTRATGARSMDAQVPRCPGARLSHIVRFSQGRPSDAHVRRHELPSDAETPQMRRMHRVVPVRHSAPVLEPIHSFTMPAYAQLNPGTCVHPSAPRSWTVLDYNPLFFKAQQPVPCQMLAFARSWSAYMSLAHLNG